jgi:hypothetical protein
MGAELLRPQSACGLRSHAVVRWYARNSCIAKIAKTGGIRVFVVLERPQNAGKRDWHRHLSVTLPSAASAALKQAHVWGPRETLRSPLKQPDTFDGTTLRLEFVALLQAGGPFSTWVPRRYDDARLAGPQISWTKKGARDRYDRWFATGGILARPVP